MVILWCFSDTVRTCYATLYRLYMFIPPNGNVESCSEGKIAMFMINIDSFSIRLQEVVPSD